MLLRLMSLQAALWTGLILAGGPTRAAPPLPPLRPIAGGTTDHGHLAVGALVSRRRHCHSETIGYVCTVTLIAPRVALTAAHCLETYGPKGPYEVLFTDDIDSPEPLAALVLETLVHPAYEAETHEMDLALLVLDINLSIPIIEPAGRLLGAEDLDSSVTAVGYGLTGPNDLGSYGIKRRGDMVVTETDENSFETEPGPAMTCSGDSGGPVLIDRGQGPKLVGVTASGDQACARYAHNIQVEAAWSDFIEPVLERAASEPPPSDEGTIGLDELCDQSCSADEDCPAHLTCLPGLGTENRCVLPGLLPGNFSGPCSDDGDCSSGTCVRIHPTGPDSCLCEIPCDQVLPPDGGMPDAWLPDGGEREAGQSTDSGPSTEPPGPGRGCSCGLTGSTSHAPPIFSCILLAIVLLLAKKRRRPTSQ